MSPDSATSAECLYELEHAEELNARVVPVRLRTSDAVALPDRLRSRQFIPPRGLFEDGFDRSLEVALRTVLRAAAGRGKRHLDVETVFVTDAGVR